MKKLRTTSQFTFTKSIRYKYYNANPTNKVTNDCVIRSLSFAYNKTWIDVFDELTSIARENFDVATSKDVYMEYVKKHGAEYIKTMTKYSRLSGGDFADQYQEGVYILRMANHLTVCRQGIIYDTWDCSEKIVYNAWLVR